MSTLRFSSRKNFSTTVFCLDHAGLAFHKFTSVNISLTGIFIKEECPFENDARVVVRFDLPEFEKFTVSAVVARIVRKKRGAGRHKDPGYGFGLNFRGVLPDEMRALLKFVAF